MASVSAFGTSLLLTAHQGLMFLSVSLQWRIKGETLHAALAGERYFYFFSVVEKNG